ncbi:MAG: 6-bladed beta-propeller [Colwellia sp.]|nr:6-bladed beta-propeller [Colwellia sp.]
MMKNVSLILFLLASFSVFSETRFSVKPAKFTLPIGWSFGEVAGISENDMGHTFIFNRGAHQLLEFDKRGRFVKEIGQGNFTKPHGLRIDRHGNIWTTDVNNHLVLRFSPEGKVTMVLGMKNKVGSGWFDRDYNLVLFDSPQDVAFDQFDNIYVVDKGNARIVKFSPDGLLIKTWGTSGANQGEFNFVHSIVIDGNNNVYVADRENKRIQVFDLDGNYKEQWNDIGYPYVLTLSNNTLWMTDARAEKVQQFSLDGELLTTYQGQAGRNPNQFGFVHGIHISKQGIVKVTQVLNWSVLSLIPENK